MSRRASEKVLIFVLWIHSVLRIEKKFSDKHCKAGTASYNITERVLTLIDEIYNSRIRAIKTCHSSDEWEKTAIPFGESLTDGIRLIFFS